MSFMELKNAMDVAINNLEKELYKALELEIPRDLLSNARINIENGKTTLIPTEIKKPLLEPKVYYDDKEIQARLEAFKKEKPILMPMDDEIGLKTIVDNINGAVAKKTAVVFIEDIIDIYNNKYYDYERYLDYKKILRETSKNKIDLQEDNLAMFMALNIEEPTLSKELFDSILKKRLSDEKGLKPIIDTYSVGETVIYQNGNKFELGIIKSVCGNDEYFVNYHTGDTAARTHAIYLHKIANNYAFHVYRLDTEDNERK